MAGTPEKMLEQLIEAGSKTNEDGTSASNDTTKNKPGYGPRPYPPLPCSSPDPNLTLAKP